MATIVETSITTTSQRSKTDLVGVQSLSYIRSIPIEFRVSGVKPNTRLYVFFDGVNVDAHCYPPGGSPGTSIVTGNSGAVTGTFIVPRNRFNTGVRVLRVQDSPLYNPSLDQKGNLVGFAQAEFTSSGIKQTWQQTVTDVADVVITRNIIADPPPPPPPDWGGGGGGGGDPLAQTFFTYGVKGGCFITRIDLYFQAKDDQLPVIVEIRNVENGYPAASLVREYSKVILDPEFVNISQNASVPTSFTFDVPVYLEEDKDYCFVVNSNSRNYQIWTSRLGEKSIETGQIVYDQPYVGSLFRSENNITWTAEQFEDIKFRIYKAKFNTNVQANVEFTSPVEKVLLPGLNFNVTAGSDVVTIAFEHEHCLDVGSIVTIDPYPDATFRGIPAASLDGNFVVQSVIDEFRVTVQSPTPATSTGTLSSTRLVVGVEVDNAGSGYATPPAVSFIGGGGTGAVAVASVANGQVTGITVLNRGSNYSTAPTVVLSGGGGFGATATAIVDAIFGVGTNRMANVITPIISNTVLPDTEIISTIRTTDAGYSLGTEKPVLLNEVNMMPNETWMVSAANQTTKMFGQNSTQLRLLLGSNNENVSPLILFDPSAKMRGVGYRINNQDEDDLDSTNSSGSIAALNITGAGSGYTITPTVTISAPDLDGGVQATATATISGGAITDIVITEAGSGYTATPSVVVTGNGNGAAVQAVLTPFNSELLPRKGNAFSKYMTKPISLATVSKGARLFMNAYSESESNIDVYIRTSLSSAGVTHTDLEYTKMNCDVERNLSKALGDYLDYTFYVDDLEPFDVYDIKIVMRSIDKSVVPSIDSYQVIILAT